MISLMEVNAFASSEDGLEETFSMITGCMIGSRAREKISLSKREGPALEV